LHRHIERRLRADVCDSEEKDAFLEDHVEDDIRLAGGAEVSRRSAASIGELESFVCDFERLDRDLVARGFERGALPFRRPAFVEKPADHRSALRIEQDDRAGAPIEPRRRSPLFASSRACGRW
jgi:hypothetical protein